MLPSLPQLSSTQGVTPDEWQVALAAFFLLGRSVLFMFILPVYSYLCEHRRILYVTSAGLAPCMCVQGVLQDGVRGLRPGPHCSLNSHRDVLLLTYSLTCRESCKIDLLPLVNHIRRRLTVSHGILADALPSHVVTAMLRDGQKRQQEKEEEEAVEEEELVVAPPQACIQSSSDSGATGRLRMGAEAEHSAGGLGEIFQQLVWGFVSVGGGRSTEEGDPCPELVTLFEEDDAASTPLWPFLSSPQLTGLSGLHFESGSPPCQVPKPMPRQRITTAAAAERRDRSASECGGVPFIPRSPLRKAPAPSLGSSPRNRGTVSMNGKTTGSSSSAAASSAGGQLMVAHHECVTIFFSDICGFSSWAHRCVWLLVHNCWLWGLDGCLVASVVLVPCWCLEDWVFGGFCAWWLQCLVPWWLWCMGMASNSLCSLPAACPVMRTLSDMYTRLYQILTRS